MSRLAQSFLVVYGILAGLGIGHFLNLTDDGLALGLIGIAITAVGANLLLKTKC